jgi:hypothetical protein
VEDDYHYSAGCGRIVELGLDVTGEQRINPIPEEPPRLYFHKRDFIKQVNRTDLLGYIEPVLVVRLTWNDLEGFCK